VRGGFEVKREDRWAGEGLEEGVTEKERGGDNYYTQDTISRKQEEDQGNRPREGLEQEKTTRGGGGTQRTMDGLLDYSISEERIPPVEDLPARNEQKVRSDEQDLLDAEQNKKQHKKSGSGNKELILSNNGGKKNRNDTKCRTNGRRVLRELYSATAASLAL